jgi:PhnB protein
MLVQSYLFFNGDCEAAVDFYKQALGARVEMLMRFREAPEAPPPEIVPPDWGDKVMHCSFAIGETRVMASDGCDTEGGSGPKNFALSLTVKDEAAARKAFDGLSAGGQVTMPLGKTFWSPCFGMLTDRFGVQWMVGVFDQPPR